MSKVQAMMEAEPCPICRATIPVELERSRLLSAITAKGKGATAERKRIMNKHPLPHHPACRACGLLFGVYHEAGSGHDGDYCRFCAHDLEVGIETPDATESKKERRKETAQ